MLSWHPPDYPNGVIVAYNIYRDNQLVGNITGDFNDTSENVHFTDSGLMAFTEYTYQIEAVNDYGSTLSPPVTYRTPSDSPQGDVQLSVDDVTARSAQLSWEQPSSANGVIERYILSSTNNLSNATVEHYRGVALEHTVSGLMPYSVYRFVLLACTSGGCLSSDPLQVITREAPPTGQQPPIATAVSPHGLHVYWAPPDSPNGNYCAFYMSMYVIPPYTS